MVNIVPKNEIEDSNAVNSGGMPVIEIAKLNAMNTIFVYLPRRCINKYSGNRVNKPYNFVLESKQMVQHINQSKENVILFGIMR